MGGHYDSECCRRSQGCGPREGGCAEKRPVTQTGCPQKGPGYKRRTLPGGGGSARIRSLVWRHFEQEIQAQIKTEAGTKMALKSEFCGKAPHYGNVISHANNTRRR